MIDHPNFWNALDEQGHHGISSVSILDDILTLATADERTLDLELIDLRALIDGCWTTGETIAETLVVETDRQVRAEESRLRQIFENLFRNAIEHGGDEVTVGDLPDGCFLEDDGPGIAPGDRESVFDTGYSNATDGTGFGLSIVERAIEAHDRDIRVTEGADGGARLEIADVSRK